MINAYSYSNETYYSKRGKASPTTLPTTSLIWFIKDVTKVHHAGLNCSVWDMPYHTGGRLA